MVFGNADVGNDGKIGNGTKSQLQGMWFSLPINFGTAFPETSLRTLSMQVAEATKGHEAKRAYEDIYIVSVQK